MEIYGVNEKSLPAAASTWGSHLLQDALEQPTALFDLSLVWPHQIRTPSIFANTFFSQVSWLNTRGMFWQQQTRGIRQSHEIMENPEYLRKLMSVIARDVTVGFGAQEVSTATAQAAALCTDPSAAMPHSKEAAGSTKQSIHSMQPQGLPCTHRYFICGSCHQRISLIHSREASLSS